MAVKITEVADGSLAQKAGILPGEILLRIDQNEITDVLDYQFYATNEKLRLTLQSEAGKIRKVKMKKEPYDDLGLGFESYLMDREHHCKNKCIFCFVDQLPKGLRETLYFKDDDARLSFLFGNYITLTNMEQKEIDRIIKMRISPINVSVHTMDPQLRVKMMGNPRAADSLSYLRQLADAGIALNTQLVVCPGVNDGAELESSIRAMQTLLPALQSIAVVPVGLTKHRDGLFPLQIFEKENARQTIRMIEAFAAEFLETYGTRLVFASDELYLRAELPLPEDEYYEDYLQLENGVGMLALFEKEVDDALKTIPQRAVSREISIATGTDAAPFIEKQMQKLAAHFPGFSAVVYPIRNDFFGETITVAGLVTGGDLEKQLADKPLGEALLLPEVMLRHEQDLFLDGVSLVQLSERLNIPVHTVPNDGAAWILAALGDVLE